MIKFLLSLSLLSSSLFSLTAQEKRTNEQVAAAMKKEQRYAQEQTFYQGEDYNLSDLEVDPNIVDSIPSLEPDYDFDMDDVYSD